MAATTTEKALAQDFLRFVNASGSPYHSVEVVKQRLMARNFVQLFEGERWRIQRGGKYFVTRNYSAIMAFSIGGKYSSTESGFQIATGHTDSPCLRVRPVSHLKKEGFIQLSVECYGGGLWHTWFDRGLAAAGKVVVRDPGSPKGPSQATSCDAPTGRGLREMLVKLTEPVAFLPNLAIHLQTAEERAVFKPHKENHLQPVLCTTVKHELQLGNSAASTEDVPTPLLTLIASKLNCSAADIVDMDLCLMDATDGRLCGVYEEFIECGRLDNQVSNWACFEAIATEETPPLSVSVAFAPDHEEIGSKSWVGAESLLLETWLRKFCVAIDGTDAEFSDMLSRSFIISSDMAHGLHPNYVDKYQKEHTPTLHKGIVIKENSNQKYTSECTSMAIARQIAEEAGVPTQPFVVKNDSPCGSTAGPSMASGLGIRTVDIGVSQLGMHSCREICGVTDVIYLLKFFKAFYSRIWQLCLTRME